MLLAPWAVQEIYCTMNEPYDWKNSITFNGKHLVSILSYTKFSEKYDAVTMRRKHNGRNDSKKKLLKKGYWKGKFSD